MESWSKKESEREKALLTDMEQKDMEKVKGCLEGIIKK